MKRLWIILVFGLLLAVAGFGALYTARTASLRELELTFGPELAWIKTEFHLSDAHFERVRALHEAYKPVCADYCRRIDEKNGEMAGLLAVSTNVTPEIQKHLTDAAQLRAQCHAEMLMHFFQVSQAMPPEQGRRYLAWMQAQTIGSTHQSMLPRVSTSAHDTDAH